MGSSIQSYRDLKVYQKAYQLSIELHRLSLSFPRHEQWILGDQIRRSSKSICANLAEGFGRQFSSMGEFRRFIVMSLGSSDEMQVWLSYCKDLGYIDESVGKRYCDAYVEVSKMLQGLYKAQH